MPRCAVGHGRAVTVLTAALVAGRDAGARANVTFSKIKAFDFCIGIRMRGG